MGIVTYPFRYFAVSQHLQAQLKLTIEQTLHQARIPGAAIAIYINSQSFLETTNSTR
jgi:hypothetical protein